MRAEYTAQELSGLLAITRRAVSKLAAESAWGFRATAGPGGGKPQKIYTAASMDPEFLKRLAEAEDRKALVAARHDSSNTPATTPTETPAPAPAPVEADPARKALARADLLRAYADALDAAGWGGRVAAREQFAAGYNAGGTHPLIHAILGPVSWRTIESWKRRTATEPATAMLADRRGGWRRGKGVVTPAQEEILLRCALNPNRPRISEAIRIAKAVMASHGIANGHSERTYRRFLAEWRSRNLHLWTFTREGKSAWNDECAMYIERDYDAIEVGDVLVADGHKLNFEILSPWTGKPKRMTLILWFDMKSNFPLGWEIMPTENTAAIAAALRRAILRLGKVPKVAYMDNGKAFGARFFKGADLAQCGLTGAFERLGIRPTYAWPYHGQSKTVERFFGTFGELERMCPTYTGTSIDEKPAHMSRGEKVHRRLHAKVMNGAAGLTMEQAHRAIASWFDEYAGRPQRGQLAGRTPMEVFLDGRGPGVDKPELTYLMMADENRTINRNGVNFLGRSYYDPALYGRRHAVTIRYDLQDTSAIYVFEPNGEYLCCATPLAKIHPAAGVLGTREDQEELAAHIRIKKGQEHEASAFARRFLEQEVLPEHNRMLEELGIGPEIAAGTPLPQRERAPKSLPAPMTEEEKRQFEAEVRELREMQAELPPEPACEEQEFECEVVDEAAEIRMKLDRMSEIDRYEALLDMDVQGLLLTKEWRAFMAYYEMTPGYERHREYFEERRLKLAAAFAR